MGSRRKRDLCLGLTGIEMKVIGVIGYGLIEGRQLGIDQLMMVPSIFAILPRRRDPHPAQSETDDHLGWNRGTILEIDEIKLGATGRMGGTAQSAPAHQSTEHQGRNKGVE